MTTKDELSIVMYYGRGEGMYATERLCLDKEEHVERRLFSYLHDWLLMSVDYLQPCDGSVCTTFTTFKEGKEVQESLTLEQKATVPAKDFPELTRFLRK